MLGTIFPLLRDSECYLNILIYLFTWGFICRFQHCTGHIMAGSFVGRRNQYIQLVRVLYCKLPTIRKQLPTFPYKLRGLNRWPQRWKVSVLPLRLSAPPHHLNTHNINRTLCHIVSLYSALYLSHPDSTSTAQALKWSTLSATEMTEDCHF